jgi:hypothetical protein
MDRPKNDRVLDEATAAKAYARAWAERSQELERLRLRQLRAMTEAESARRFAELLAPDTGIAPQRSSGLVEQQRVFARLRTQ